MSAILLRRAGGIRLGCEHRVTAAHQVEIAGDHATGGAGHRLDPGAVAVVRTERAERRCRGEHLLGGRGGDRLLGTVSHDGSPVRLHDEAAVGRQDAGQSLQRAPQAAVGARLRCQVGDPTGRQEGRDGPGLLRRGRRLGRPGVEHECRDARAHGHEDEQEGQDQAAHG